VKLPLRPCLLFLLLLPACEGETEEEVPPEEDGVIACGGTESLEGLTTGDTINVSAEPGGSMVFDVAVGEADGHGLRLRAEASGSWRRVTEIWTPEGDRRVIPATAGAGESLSLEVIVPPDETLTGVVTLACADVPEVCFDLADNDGNGAVDCADLGCARDEDCAEDQEDFQIVEPECSDDFVEVEVDELDRLSDQRTLYETRPAGDGAPWQEFRGGGEIVLMPPLDPGSVTVEVGGTGVLCLGAADATGVVCRDLQTLADGDLVSLQPGELPGWFEPDTPNWTSFAVRVDCGTD
jgi:hypothetical protein